MDYIWQAPHLCFVEKCGVQPGDTFRTIWRRIIVIEQVVEMPRVVTEMSRDFCPSGCDDPDMEYFLDMTSDLL